MADTFGPDAAATSAESTRSELKIDARVSSSAVGAPMMFATGRFAECGASGLRLGGERSDGGKRFCISVGSRAARPDTGGVGMGVDTRSSRGGRRTDFGGFCSRRRFADAGIAPSFDRFAGFAASCTGRYPVVARGGTSREGCLHSASLRARRDGFSPSCGASQLFRSRNRADSHRRRAPRRRQDRNPGRDPHQARSADEGGVRPHEAAPGDGGRYSRADRISSARARTGAASPRMGRRYGLSRWIAGRGDPVRGQRDPGGRQH